MTVCIAAIADNHEAIVSCADTRISTGITSTDPLTGPKMSGYRGWTLLTSGTLSLVEAFVDLAQANFEASPENAPEDVQDSLEAALRTELPRFLSARYLAPYGLNMEAFLNSTPSGITEQRWNELHREMLLYADYYDVEVIVSGWGAEEEQAESQPQATIFSVSRHGVSRHSHEGFYACGSGAEAAHSTLCFLNQQPSMLIAQTIYNVAAAKFSSERTSGVGPRTLIRVSTRQGDKQWKGYFIQPDEVEMIRKLWMQDTNFVVTPSSEDALIEMRKKHGAQRVRPNYMAQKLASVEDARRSDSRTSESEM